uniref:Uncharacterized protein n=1 Tax=Tanacetum cinerariifolium TaxID=118510 RepID=A0A6L2LEW9_TANCI|nr:hypothetical protein [Tanacetum cinerariifolium]
MDSSKSSQANKPYFPINRVSLDMDFEQLMHNQEYYPTQDYFMGQGLTLVEDDKDSPVEEIERGRVVLSLVRCVSNYEQGNSMKAKGLWDVVKKYFKGETRSARGRQIHEHKSTKWEKIQEQQDSYIQLKNHESDIQEAAHKEAVELKRAKLEIQCRTLELAEKKKRDKDKHQLKFNSHNDAKTLMKAIEKRFGGNTETKKVRKTLLNQQYENFTGSSSESLDQIHDRLQKLTHTLIWRNKTDLEEQSLNDLFNSLKIYEAEVKSSSFAGTTTQNIAFVSSSNTNSTTESVSTAASVFVVNAKLHASSLPNVDSLSNAIDADDLEEEEILEEMDLLLWVLICPMWSVITATGRDILQESVEEEPANYALMAFSSSSSSSDNESDESWPPSSLYDRFDSSDGYHVVPLPYTRTFMPPKPDLVINTAPNDVETDHPVFTVKLSPTKPDQGLSHTNRPLVPIIEDYVSDSKDESETKAPQIVPSFVQSTEQVKSPRHSVQHVETSILVATPKPASPKPTSYGKRRNRKACFVCKSLDHLIKDCDYHEKKMAKPTARNHAHRGIHKQYA